MDRLKWRHGNPIYYTHALICCDAISLDTKWNCIVKLVYRIKWYSIHDFNILFPLSQFQFRVYSSSLHRVNLNSSFSFYRAMLWYSAMFVCQSLSGCLPHSSIVSKWLYGSLRNRRCMESFSVSNDLFICSIVTADKYLYQKLDGKYTERVKLPAKAKFVFFSPTLGNTCHKY